MERRQSREQLEWNVVAEVWSIELVGLAENVVSVESLDVHDRLKVGEELGPEGAWLQRITLGEELAFVGGKSSDHLSDTVDGAAIGFPEDLAVIDETCTIVDTAMEQSN